MMILKVGYEPKKLKWDFIMWWKFLKWAFIKPDEQEDSIGTYNIFLFNPFIDMSSNVITYLLHSSALEKYNLSFNSQRLIYILAEILLYTLKNKTPSYQAFANCPLDSLPEYIQQYFNQEKAMDLLTLLTCSGYEQRHELRIYLFDLNKSLYRKIEEEINLVDILNEKKNYID